MGRWIVGFLALGVLAGCSGDLEPAGAASNAEAPAAAPTEEAAEDIVTVIIDGEPADDAAKPVDCAKPPMRKSPVVSPALNRTLEAGCWAADVELPEGGCQTAHSHIAKAMNSCWSKGGEAINVAVWNTCETGYRAAAVTCCPALPNATPPPESLPEPVGSDAPPSSCGACSGASGTSSQRAACLGETSINEDIVGVVMAAVARGDEVHDFHYGDRCADGGFATSGFGACSAGTRSE